MSLEFIMPPTLLNEQKQERRVGYEIEFSGIGIEKIVSIIQNIYGGTKEIITPYKVKVNTPLGTFKVELDFKLIKEGLLKQELEKELHLKEEELKIIEELEELIASISEKFVPYEVVSPPIALSKMHELLVLEEALRKNGAVGTTASLFYGFGLHINPETPSFKVETLLSYLRAFLCLYEWLLEKNKVDFTRRILPFIKPFEKEYVLLVLNENYNPTIEEFIDNYLEYNPTRNRPLDMLPLLAYIDEAKVRSAIKNQKLSIRPAFHYRLPDSRIDTQKYNLAYAWNSWVEVEKLAHDKDKLLLLSKEYKNFLEDPLSLLFDSWSEKIEDFLDETKS
jgi:hypothetical protein